MKAIVDFIDQEKCGFPKDRVVAVCNRTIQSVEFLESVAKKIRLSVAFIGIEKMKELNARYRKKNKPTDVLSFGEFSSQKSLKAIQADELFLGEILICCEYLQKSDTMKARNADHAVSLRIAHGILHLAGFRHGEKMYQLQDQAAQ